MTNTYKLVLLEEDELKINKQKGKKGTSRKIKIYAQKKKKMYTVYYHWHIYPQQQKLHPSCSIISDFSKRNVRHITVFSMSQNCS